MIFSPLSRGSFFCSCFLTPSLFIKLKQNRFENQSGGAKQLPNISPRYSRQGLISGTPLFKEFFSEDVLWTPPSNDGNVYIKELWDFCKKKDYGQSVKKDGLTDFYQIIQNRFFIIRAF